MPKSRKKLAATFSPVISSNDSILGPCGGAAGVVSGGANNTSGGAAASAVGGGTNSTSGGGGGANNASGGAAASVVGGGANSTGGGAAASVITNNISPTTGVSAVTVGVGCGGANVVPNTSNNGGAEGGGAVEMKGEKEKGNVNVSVPTVGDDNVIGANSGAEGGEVNGGVGGAAEGASGGVEEGEVEAGCNNIPQMSRRRLREILHHSEGKCS